MSFQNTLFRTYLRARWLGSYQSLLKRTEPGRRDGERRLNPRVEMLLDSLPQSPAPTVSQAAAFRKLYANIDLGRRCPERGLTIRHMVPVDGGQIEVREYRPKYFDHAQASVMFFHGGGWVVGDCDSHDDTCSHIAHWYGARVFSVNYRLAPEHPFPTPLDDCEAAWNWLGEQSEEFGLDPSRRLLMGDSAGGTLACALNLRLAAKDQPTSSAQCLIYPVTDCGMDTKSYESFESGYLLTKDAMKFFWDCYVPDAKAREHYECSPLRAPKELLAKLPTTVVSTAHFDVLRDEGHALADKLEEAGVRTLRAHIPDQIHGFATMLMLQDSLYSLVDAVYPARILAHFPEGTTVPGIVGA